MLKISSSGFSSKKEKLMRTQILCLLALLALCAVTVNAQTSRGTVTGVITDPNGAVVAGATITLTSGETSQTRTTTSNSEGVFANACGTITMRNENE